MTSPLGPDSGLFAGTAWHYARYRPGYPQAFVDDLVTGLSLDGTRRLLDLGCGTGQLTIPLAPHVAEAVGMDPEPEMLTEAAKSARAAGITNVTWAQGNSADLPGDFGRFLLVTMGRSFHWMDREQVLTALDAIVDHGGAVVLANDSCLVRPNSPWQQAVEDIQHRFLPPDSVRPTPLPGRMNSPADHQPHEQILARSAFRHVDRRVCKFERPWAVDQVIGYLYSTSLPLRRLLGDRVPAFEQEITDTLHMFRHNGLLIEPVTLEVLIGTKQ